jgi:glycine dehydrogenase subunit 1
MRYLPKSPADREQMMREIGIQSIDELFAPIPAEYRLDRDLKVPRQMAESEIIDYFRGCAETNAAGYAVFLGAGAYHHYRPVVIDSLISRGEFFTAYTPYQPEISQGTLQAIFEFQTLMCQLTGMEVANASMWDGSTATTEAVLMAERLTGRHRVVVARSLHPEYRQVLDTYTRNLGLRIDEIGFTGTGQVDANRLGGLITSETAAVVVQSPNFFGTLEQISSLASLAHAKGALLVVSITEGVAFGAVRPPVESDIVAMETQSFGLPQSYGGPYAGVIATREKFVRQLPGRLAGETVDSAGKRGYVLTLATREQHIRREKATSNICTNQALCALAVNVHLCLLGKEGLKEVAGQNLAKARFALELLESVRGVRRAFSGPFFNEFVVEFPRSVKMINAELLKHKIIGPLPIGSYFSDLTKRGLFCVTETVSRAEIERMVEAVREILAKPI